MLSSIIINSNKESKKCRNINKIWLSVTVELKSENHTTKTVDIFLDWVSDFS